MRCIRICGAYSYRLSRRHSTVFLIASFIFTITLLLQLYSYRHHESPSKHHSIGDYDYRPGAFLTGRQQDNESYCHFNYGLPDTLKWEIIRTYPSPELGITGPFRIIYNAIKGTAYENSSKHNNAVTYATQATPEFLYHIIEIAKYWDGPISLSVFVPDYDLDITMQIMDHLCHCYSGMAKVSLHLFYNKMNPPRMKREPPVTPTPTPIISPVNETVEEILRRKMENFRNLNNETRAAYIQNAIKNKIKRMMVQTPKIRPAAPYLTFNDCSGLQSYDFPTYRRLHSLAYPINVGRNSARNASKTNYVMVSDIEMVPSDGLARKFVRMLKKLIYNKNRDENTIIPNTAFVVPVFEVERGERIPRDKEELVNLISDNRAMYFHQKICTHCQRFPGLQMWLKKPPKDDVQPLLIAKREYPYHRWEPLYFGTNKDPWYSERLLWEGQQDKMTQMLELCLQVYRMVVLDGGFLCHAARDLRGRFRNKKAINNNAKVYLNIIEAFKKMYPERSQCRIDYGFKKSQS